MCGPAIGLIGAGVSAIGAMQQANAQANIAEHNAKVEKINARHKRNEGAREQEMISQKYDRIEGQGVAAASKGGVDASFGSAALVIFGEGAENKSQDRNSAYVNSESQAVAHENKAKQLEAEAAATRQGGKISAASSFLSGLGGAMKGGGGGSSMFKIA